MLIKKIAQTFALSLLLTASPCLAGISITFPFTESFEANDYSDQLWLTSSATHTWLEDGGWDGGGAAKFTPPTIEGYSGLGQYTGLSGNILNVRFLIYYGPTFVEHSSDQNKLFLLVPWGAQQDPRQGNRPMMITRVGSDTNWMTYGPCDGTVCFYGQEGVYHADGTETFRIGPSPNRQEEWISVEVEANISTGVINLYVDTQDGEFSGLFLSTTGDMVGPWDYIDILGGYFHNGSVNDAGSYFIIDELVVDDSYIGPPAGFVTSGGPINGVCGSNNGGTFSTLASGTTGNCATGTVSSFTAVSGGWEWGCAGSNGGTSVTNCAATQQAVGGGTGRAPYSATARVPYSATKFARYYEVSP